MELAGSFVLCLLWWLYLTALFTDLKGTIQIATIKLMFQWVINATQICKGWFFTRWSLFYDFHTDIIHCLLTLVVVSRKIVTGRSHISLWVFKMRRNPYWVRHIIGDVVFHLEETCVDTFIHRSHVSSTPVVWKIVLCCKHRLLIAYPRRLRQQCLLTWYYGSILLLPY